VFRPRYARKTLRRYRKKGLDEIEQGMVASVPAHELDGARILEIGGGVGTIQAELLAAGADRGEIVELVSAYEPYARELAHEKGIESRSTFRVADILEEPDAVAPADIVVLNRVVCCSPEGVRLTAVAASHAERMLLLSFPRDRFLVRVVSRVMNATMRLMGRSFRTFLHPPASLLAAAQAHGLVLAATGHQIAWEFAVLRRPASSSAGHPTGVHP
jgi:magnesium-protoporphyrin O-methyltransferase